MITIKQLEKYYNKNKVNENHVLKTINLTFDTTGLTVLLGQSGSGKTTLLNTISGMDSFDQGTITINEQTINKYNERRFKRLRNQTLGYIFQNYNLLPQRTVYENIELALNIYGIHDRLEIDKRIKYLLEKVQMSGYEDRRADQLSGGQKQRIAFARALSTNPDIIIADEPTGNLDSKTTIEIMNILQQISKEKLVIMVTHEQEIASFYGDRIIEISDGMIIKDYPNKYQGDLTIIQEHIIYLKDYENHKKQFDQLQVELYNDHTKENYPIGLQLIKRHDTLYIHVNEHQAKRIKFIDHNSEIELLDSSYTDHHQIDSIPFAIDDIIDDSSKTKKGSFLSIKESLRSAFSKLKNVSYGGKMLFVVLFFIGALISISVGLLGRVFHVDDSNFVNRSRNYITIHVSELNYDEIQEFEEFASIEAIQLIDKQVTFHIATEPYYQVRTSIEVDAQPTDIQFLNESLIVHGSMPQEEYGVVIDQSIADKLIKQYGERGVDSYDDILDMSLKYQTSGEDFDQGDQRALLFPIEGIAYDNSPTIWMKSELMYSLAMPTLTDYRLLEPGLTVTSGVLPVNFQQVSLSEESTVIRAGEVPSNVGITYGRFDVTSTYKYEKDGLEYDTSYLMLTNVTEMKKIYFYKNDYGYVNYSFLAYTNDVNQAIQDVELLGYRADSEYSDDYEQFSNFQFDAYMEFYIISIVGIIISAISMYFIMRSQLIARIHEISVYRSLGASKGHIRSFFIIDIIVITSISSVVGFLVMMFLLLQAQSQVIEYVQIVYYNIFYLLGGIGLIYGINLVFGLLPIEMLLFKTPAQIMTKYDM